MQIGLAIFTAGSLYAGFLEKTGNELIIYRIVIVIVGSQRLMSGCVSLTASVS
jgi:hypothetical protein